MDVVSAVRKQAEWCAELGSPMYAALLTRVADDIDRGGVCAQVVAGHEDEPVRSALALRLLGSVHRLVLDGTAAELAEYYPTAGGRWRAEPGWEAFTATLERHIDAVRSRLDQAPQTNEVGRAAALMGGLLHLVDERGLPVRLFEMGASAGLNLRADHYCYVDEHEHTYGRPDSPLRLRGAWRGRQLPSARVDVVERRGCDVAPLDATTRAGRLTLQSYVWPDQRARWLRLQEALLVAAAVPAGVCRQRAAAFVGGLELADDTTTVLWHSVMWQYLDAAEQQAVTEGVDALADQASARRGFAHLTLEPVRRRPGEEEHEFLVVLRTWPGGGRRVLGSAAPHGVPTVWE